MCACLTVCLSIQLSDLLEYLCIHLSNWLVFHLSICVSVYLAIWQCPLYLLSIYLLNSTYLAIYLSIHRAIYPSACLSVCLSVCPYLSVCLFACPSIWLSIYYLPIFICFFPCTWQSICLSNYFYLTYLSDYLSSWPSLNLSVNLSIYFSAVSLLAISLHILTSIHQSWRYLSVSICSDVQNVLMQKAACAFSTCQLQKLLWHIFCFAPRHSFSCHLPRHSSFLVAYEIVSSRPAKHGISRVALRNISTFQLFTR